MRTAEPRRTQRNEGNHEGIALSATSCPFVFFVNFVSQSALHAPKCFRSRKCKTKPKWPRFTRADRRTLRMSGNVRFCPVRSKMQNEAKPDWAKPQTFAA